MIKGVLCVVAVVALCSCSSGEGDPFGPTATIATVPSVVTSPPQSASSTAVDGAAPVESSAAVPGSDTSTRGLLASVVEAACQAPAHLGRGTDLFDAELALPPAVVDALRADENRAEALQLAIRLFLQSHGTRDVANDNTIMDADVCTRPPADLVDDVGKLDQVDACVATTLEAEGCGLLD